MYIYMTESLCCTPETITTLGFFVCLFFNIWKLYFNEQFFSAVILFFYYYFLAVLRSMWDLTSPTRDRTHSPCIGNAES